AGVTLRLRDLVLVVGEDQIGATTVNVDRLAEIAQRHRRALDMPAGAARPPRAVPRRLAGLGALPEREVSRVLLAVARLDALALDDRVHALVRELAVVRLSVDAVVDIAARRVGVLARQ